MDWIKHDDKSAFQRSKIALFVNSMHKLEFKTLEAKYRIFVKVM